jgi:coenzyme F420 hydrogenase subunit beta
MCAGSCSKGRIRLEYVQEQQQFVPVVEGWEPTESADEQLVCPGDEIDMNYLSQKVHGRLPDDYLYGVYNRVRVCYARDENTRRAAASGGIVPAVLKHLFDRGSIDMAYCLVPGAGAYEAKGRIIRSPAQLAGIHGSVYHPFDFGAELRQLIREETGKFAFVGLPCQIAGLEMLKIKIPGLAGRHVISIGLFCGGVNRFGGVAYYLKGFGVPWEDVGEIEYRHGSWPGKIRLQRKSTGEFVIIPRIANNSRWKILRYMAAFQGYWMLKRCRLCPDQIADFADIAVGDPHVSAYRKRDSPGYSVVISRTPRGEDLLYELIERDEIREEPAQVSLVRDSQGSTLDNRRHVLAYLRIARMLREPVPDVKVYREAASHIAFRHYRYAAVELLKIKLRHWILLRPFYPLIQAFEYMFITLYPSLFFKHLKNLICNKGTDG